MVQARTVMGVENQLQLFSVPKPLHITS